MFFCLDAKEPKDQGKKMLLRACLHALAFFPGQRAKPLKIREMFAQLWNAIFQVPRHREGVSGGCGGKPVAIPGL